MRVRKGQIYLKWSSRGIDAKEYVKALYRLPGGEWMVQPYDIALCKCVEKGFAWPPGLLRPSDVEVVVKRETPGAKVRRKIARQINKIRTRQYRPECRGCRHFVGGWDRPVVCIAPKAGKTDASIQYLVGFTKRPCSQREQRPIPTVAEGGGDAD